MKGIRRLLLPLFLAALVAAITPLTALAATQPRLGTATTFALLAGQAITNTSTAGAPTTINGDVGLSPKGLSSVTGFGVTGAGVPPASVINGATHYADGVALQAQNDLTTAYNDAAAQTPTTSLTGKDLGTVGALTPGVYFFSSSAQLTGTLTLSGFGVYVFQIGSTLTTASDSSVLLTNNAQACGVYWQVASSATFGSATSFQGTVMALQSISMDAGVTLIGRALARNASVTLISDTIRRPEALCTGLPFSTGPGVPATGVPSELLGQFPWLLVIGLGSGLAVVALGISSRRRRRSSV